MQSEFGKIILINGTSSSGKTTLCNALTDILPVPFWHFSSDHLIDSGMRPDARLQNGDFEWNLMRKAFFSGFHHMIPAFAKAGNNLLVEHIVEEQLWATELFGLLEYIDLFVVSARCPDSLLIERERERGDRAVGEAMYHKKTYDHVRHDIEVDCSLNAVSNAQLIMDAWKNRGVSNSCFKDRGY